jgi:adenylate cyclase
MSSFPTDKIEAQLKRILATPEFVAGKKMSQFLQYVVEQSLNGQSGSIKQYTIAVEALGYEADFDPTANPSVRTLARRLRRALEQYYSAQGIEDPIRIDIPKGSYVPVIMQNQDNPQDAESTCESQFSMLGTIKPQESVPDGPSIAILPFKYHGNEPEYAYIASGIAEEVVIALTRFQEFFVVGPLNRDIIRQRHLGPRAFGQEYNVRFLLDGTVRLRGRTLRLTTKLTDTLNGRKLWGQIHDHDIERASIDQVDNEIVGQIVTTIADNFGVIPRTLAKEVLSRHNDSLSDYAAILRFHHHVRVLTEKSLTEAIEALEKVVQCNPDHDLALALLGDLISTPYWLGYTDSQFDLGRA